MMSRTKVNIISSGGILNKENRMCLYGEDAAYIFNNVYANYVFFATKALSDDGVIWDFSREEVIIRNAMLRNAEKKVFLCDSEKFHSHSAYKQCTLNDIDYLVCENDEGKKYSQISENLTVI